MENEIDDATLGFALINVVMDDDAFRGPKMLKRTINRRFVDENFITKFARGVDQQGLHNRSSVNAITIGVRRSYIKADSLRPIELGQFTNKVQWTAPARGEDRTMVLYNGSHRIYYLSGRKEVLDGQEDYDQISRTLETTKDKKEKEELQKKLAEVLKRLDQHGVWLAKFLDIGEHPDKRAPAYFRLIPSQT